MPRIKLDPDGILSLRGIFQQELQVMSNVEQDIACVLNDLDIEVASSEGIRTELAALRQCGQRYSGQIEAMVQTLDRVCSSFISTDQMITKQAGDIQYTADWILTAFATGMAAPLPLSVFNGLDMTDKISEVFGGTGGNSTPFPLDYLVENQVAVLSEIKSGMGNIKDLTNIYSLFSDSELMQTLGDYAEEIGKDTVLKVASYLDDGKDLLEAISSGDADTLEELIEKYAKKGVQVATGFESSFGSIYLDLGWNLGENAAESVQSFIEEPSLDSLLSGVWNVTGGTFIDAGKNLASGTLDFLYGLVGADFDEQDFNNAMEYLGDSIVGGLNWAGEAVAEGILAAGDAVASAGEAIASGVASLGSAIADGWNSFWSGDWF